MSNLNEISDIANFYRLFKQFADTQRSEVPQPQNSTGPYHPTSQAPYVPFHRQSPARHRPQPYRQTTPPRTASEFLAISQNIDEMKKRLNDIYTAIDNLQHSLEQVKVTVEEGMARMNGNMERFEVIGRNFLKQALQSSNSQPQNSAPSQPQASNTPPFGQNTSQQQTSSNLQNPYSQGSHVTQPPTSFVPSSNPSQPVYAIPPSQAPESYSDPNYNLDYAALDFLVNDNS